MTGSPKTVEEQALRRLRQAILDEELPRDVFLSQRNLAKIAGAGVVTVRACLRTLESEGLLENLPRWGVRIPSETEERVQDRCFLRELLEPVAARRFVEYHTPAQAARLRELAEQCDNLDPVHATGCVANYDKLHYEYHNLVAVGSGSPQLREALNRTFLGSLTTLNARYRHKLGQFFVSHTALTDELLSGNPDRAEQAMREHAALGLSFELAALRKRVEQQATHTPPPEPRDWLVQLQTAQEPALEVEQQ